MRCVESIFLGMPNPQLNPEQRESLFKPLFAQTLRALEDMAEGDVRLQWALRRKLAKELGYLERSKPAVRKRLKAKKWAEQNGVCPICNRRLPKKNGELDRQDAFAGYTLENTRLIHHRCHKKAQAQKGYA